MNTLTHLMQILNPDSTLAVSVQCDERGEPDYDSMVWESEDVPRPSRNEFQQAVAQAKAMQYKTDRRLAYPSVEEQLDLLYHGGLDVWRDQIAAVKEQFPKPEELPQ